MSVVTFCSGIFCRGGEAAQETARRLDCSLYTDQDLAQRAAKLGPLSEAKLLAAVNHRPGALSNFAKQRAKALPQLTRALASLLLQGPMVYRGLGSHLIPKSVTHVLSVCLIAGMEYRLARAKSGKKLNEKQARERIAESDRAARLWTEFLHGREAWDAQQYDILTPMDEEDMDQVISLIIQSAHSEPLQLTDASRRAVKDMSLAGEVGAELARRGYYYPEFKASAWQEKVSIEINKKVLRLGKLEKDLEQIAARVEGVEEVDTKVGPGYHQSDVYRQSSFSLPAKVLLVDDERDFVETLSERLQLRDVGASVVYDGEQALKSLAEDKPEVVVLDLRMPGVDGIEVLASIKKDFPEVEVIVLTGHGSSKDRQKCLALGAFAFLQKPVDFEELAEVMRQAAARKDS